jgi:hypothetical protein
MLTNDESSVTHLGRRSGTTMASRAELADAPAGNVIDFELGRKALEQAGLRKQEDVRPSRILIDPRPGNALLESIVTTGLYLLLALALVLAFALFCG